MDISANVPVQRQDLATMVSRVLVYRYINRDGLAECLANGVRPNPNGEVFLTPHLFRYAEEARRFLALQPGNKAEVGLMIDPAMARFPIGRFGRRICARKFRQPGGAIELIVNPSGRCPRRVAELTGGIHAHRERLAEDRLLPGRRHG